MDPLLKWAGGKGQLLSKLIPYITQQRLDPNNGVYYEPFFGGGSLCLNMMFPRIVINDYNPEVINVYRQVKEHPYELIEVLSHFETKLNKEEYYRIRDWDREETYNDRSLIERAGRIIYLNRTCWNGLYRVNKQGHFNTPIGSRDFPIEKIKSRILSISQYFNDAQVNMLNTDFAQCVESAGVGDFVYFDPPYDYKGDGFNRYVDNKFTRADLIRLKHISDELIDRGCSVLISNNKTEFVEDLFLDPRYLIEEVSANRCLNSDGNNRTNAKEVIIYAGQ